jgi:hypothetical protein
MKTKEEDRAYEAAYREKNREHIKVRGREYYAANREHILARVKDYRASNKERVNARSKKYYEANKERVDAVSQIYREAHREFESVRSHHYHIFNPKATAHKNYEGMPFYDGWNPAKGGSLQAGEDWIIKNIGKRPDGTTLHIVDHVQGFVPGNLEWTHQKKQTHQQMCKIIAQQRNRIKKLEDHIEELEGIQCAS